MARRFCQPPESADTSTSKSSNPARPSVSAKRAPRSESGVWRALHGLFDYRADRLSSSKSRVLLDIDEAQALTESEVSVIGIFNAGQNP